MKTWKRVVGGLLALALIASPAVVSAQTYWWFQAVNEDEEPFTEPGAVRCRVYSPNGSRFALLHTTQALDAAYLHALSSSSNGIMHFWSSTYGASDVLNMKCWTLYGDFAMKSRVTSRTHKIRIDTSGSSKVTVFEWIGTGQNIAGRSAGVTIPGGALITGVALELERVYLDSAHINIGFSGNHLGAVINALGSQVDLLVNGPAVTSPARNFLYLHQQAVVTTPAGAAAVAASHMGTLLRHATGIGPTGVGPLAVVSRPYMVHVGTGMDVQYQVNGNVNAAGWTCQGADPPCGASHGLAYIFWQRLHLGINRQPLQ